MDSINNPKAEKGAVQEKPMAGVELIEKTPSTDSSDNNTAAEFDGLSDSECKALEKRRVYFTLAESSLT